MLPRNHDQPMRARNGASDGLLKPTRFGTLRLRLKQLVISPTRISKIASNPFMEIGVSKSRVHPITSSVLPRSVTDVISMKQYVYSSLRHSDSIRVLTLLPGEESDSIAINLREVRSKDDPQYDALSYTWASSDGDSARSEAVVCDGCHIMVTRNCISALRRIRKRDKDHVLWVDAICIDQENEQERGHQVRLMRDIYSQANEVLVWLGEASKQTDSRTGQPVSEIYLQHVGQMAAEMRDLQRRDKPAVSSILYQQVLTDMKRKLSNGDETSLLQGLFYIHKRPWWERVWVLQEVALAKKPVLMCSQQTADYPDVAYFENIIIRDKQARDHLGPRGGIRALLKCSREHLSTVQWTWFMQLRSDHDISEALLRVISRARYLKASDPRDIIYGILGLHPTLERVLPSPEYRRSPSEVFVEVVRKWIERFQTLEILQELHAPDPASSHPSWAPDWSRSSVMNHLSGGINNYCAANYSKADCEFHREGAELRAKGKHVDWVRTLSFVPGTWDMESSRGIISAWKDSCNLGASLAKYHTGENIVDVLWRTLCCNTDLKSIYPAPVSLGSQFRRWYDLLSSGSSIENLEKEMKRERDGKKLPRFAWLLTKPICITADGLMALVPPLTESGDRIVIFAGSKIPFIIRPVEDRYRMVGPCYVHGIMNGEAWPDDENELEWFSIW